MATIAPPPLAAAPARGLNRAPRSPYILRGYYMFYVAVVLASSLSSLVPEPARFAVNYLGEVLTILSIPFAAIAFKRMSRRGQLMALFFGAFAFMEILSTLVYPLRGFPQEKAAAIGLFLDAKLFILMMTTAYFASRDIEGVARYVQYILWLFLVLVWVTSPFILRDMYDGRFNIYGDALLRRSGFPVPTGIYQHKAIAAQMALLAIIAGIALIGSTRSHTARQFVLASVMLGVAQVFMSLSVKELISLLFVGIIYFSQARGTTQPGRLFAMALLGGLLMVGLLSTQNRVSSAALERIDRYTGEQADSRIRNLLISTSIEIAAANFPLGTGPGTFASEPARSQGYSPVYVKYKFYRYVGGRADGEVQFLVDGFWPKILGEAGIIGFFFYVTAIVLVLMQVAEMRRRFPDARLFLFIQYVWVAVMPITLASGILTNERFVLLLALTGACLVRLSPPGGSHAKMA